MTDSFKPTRAQLMGLLDYLASWSGSAYKDGDTKLRLYEMDGPTNSNSKKVGTVPERALAQHREAWLRDNWADIIDHYVDDGFAVEDEPILEDKPCPREVAHGEHRWDYTQFPDVKIPLEGQRPFAALNWALSTEFHCEGIKAHSSTAIGGATTGRPADYGQIDVGALTGGGIEPGTKLVISGSPKAGKSPTPTSPEVMGSFGGVVMGGASIETGVEKLKRPEPTEPTEPTGSLFDVLDTPLQDGFGD